MHIHSENPKCLKSVLLLFLLLLVFSGCIPVTSRYSKRKPGSGNSKNDRTVSLVTFSPGDYLVLSDLLEHAVNANPALKSIHSKWEASLEKIKITSSLPDPRVTYGVFIEPIETKTGAQRQKVGLSQTFPWFGKLPLKEKVSILEAEVIWKDYLAKKLQIQSDVSKLFYEYGYLHEELEVSKEHQKLLGLMESIASIRYKIGKLSQSALLQIQIEQAKLENRDKELESYRKQICAQMFNLLGSRNGDLLPWPNRLDLSDTTPGIEGLETALPSGNLSWQTVSILIEKEEKLLRLADLSYYPDVTLGVELIDIDGGKAPVVAVVSMNIPLRRKKLDAAKRAAIKRKSSLSQQLAEIENNLFSQYEVNKFHFQNAVRKADLFAETLSPKAQQALNVAMKGFEKGTATSEELLSSARTLLEFRLVAYRELTSSKKIRADILNLVGKQLEK